MKILTVIPKGFAVTAALLLSTAVGLAQDTAHISVRSLTEENAALLRWAVSTPASWLRTNRYGFNIERYTIVRDGSALTQPEMKQLNYAPVKAKPLNEWEGIAQTDDYAAVIAQALYGDEFGLAANTPPNSITAIVNMSQELEQRFAISLFAADNSFAAALMAGWAWSDTTVKRNERYLYRIISAAPDNSSLHIEYGSVFVATDEMELLPRPTGLLGVFGNKSVALSWDYLVNVYHSYYIEKSADGKNYSRLDGVPVTNMNNADIQTSPRMYFMDSLTDNIDTFYYRLVGITPFGKTGPPSDSIFGRGKELFRYVPYINYTDVTASGDLDIGWEFDEKGNALIKGFELKHSPNSEIYKTVLSDIEPEVRSALIDREKISLSNYFIITAIPHEGEPASSFPVLVQPIDSVPPVIPAGLTGTVDSSGAVTLRWDRNTEKDLYGYKVFRAHLNDEELIPLFDRALEDTVYRDTVEIDNLNRHVYYAVAALDRRYNQSDLSPRIELAKPDIVPPSPPAISGYRIKDEGIELSWHNSSSPGVTSHRIYRKNRDGDESSQILLAAVADTAQTDYTDTSATAGVYYVYTATALKNNELESSPSNRITLFTVRTKHENAGIDRFDAIVDTQNRMLKLVWTDRLPDVLYYEIYRGTNDRKASLWKTLKNGEHEITDSRLSVGVDYVYIIRAILKSGKNTASKSLNIKYGIEKTEN
jgi:fibronectin type 3 domain-containing protein